MDDLQYLTKIKLSSKFEKTGPPSDFDKKIDLFFSIFDNKPYHFYGNLIYEF